MTRLCGLNPTIDYSPVKWALRYSEGCPRVINTFEAETSVTAYESLSDDDRAILLLLNGRFETGYLADTRKITIDFRGKRFEFFFRSGYNHTLKSFIGHLLDYGYCPDMDYQFKGYRQ